MGPTLLEGDRFVDRMIVRRGFTLIELLLVVAILAILTAVILPKFDGLQSKVNHGVGAASADDTGRLIVTYKVTKNKYPNGWDSLLDVAGTDFWKAADPTKKGIHTQLAGFPIAGSGAKLALATLTAPQVDSLSRRGITKIFNLAPTADTSTTLPGDCYNVPGTLTTGSTVCVLNTATPGGKKMIDSIYPANTVSGGVSGTLPSGKTVVVFGLGPRNDLIGTSMTDCPFYPNVDLTLVYNRNLVAFEISDTGGAADFKGVFGTDGDLKSDMANAMFK
jgi:prepilin-type N-terminal cleavage/methylation domain-containing protein